MELMRQAIDRDGTDSGIAEDDLIQALGGGVAVEGGLDVLGDPSTSKAVTASELYSQDAYGRVTGASGTANGKGDRFAAQGLPGAIAWLQARFAGQPAPSTTVIGPAGAATDSRFTSAWRTASRPNASGRSPSISSARVKRPPQPE